MLRLDGMMLLVPATWTIPGAAPINTSRNKDFSEGRVTPVKADVGELIRAGVKVPNALFEAHGTNTEGGNVGVVAGVFDIGAEDPLTLVRASVAQITPDASIDEATVRSADAIRTLLRWDNAPAEGGSVICDYWGTIRHAPTSVALFRFWRTGPSSADEEADFDDMAGSILYAGPADFAGPGRHFTLQSVEPPGREVAAPSRFRYAGWRLGAVFHSKMLSAKRTELATELSFSGRDGVLMLVVFFAWLAATWALVGVGSILLLGGLSTTATLPKLRNQGMKAVVRLAVILAALLAFGVATS